MINIIKSTIHFKSLTLMIKKQQINNSFQGIMRGLNITLVTIRGGGGVSERRGGEDQDKQGLGDEGVKVQ